MQRKIIRVPTRAEEVMVTCRNCGAEALVGFKFCQTCGAVLPLTGPKVDALPFKKEKTAILLAALPGVLVMGIGHFYLVRVARGLMFLVASIATGILFFVAVFGAFFSASFLVAAVVGSLRLILWIWQVIDARSLTNKYNEFLENTGKPLW